MDNERLSKPICLFVEIHLLMVPNICYCAFKMIRKIRQLGRKCGNPMLSIVNYVSLLPSDKITHCNIGEHLNLIFNSVSCVFFFFFK